MLFPGLASLVCSGERKILRRFPHTICGKPPILRCSWCRPPSCERGGQIVLHFWETAGWQEVPPVRKWSGTARHTSPVWKHSG